MQMSSSVVPQQHLPMLQVENLSKLYRLGEFGSGTLQEDLQRFWAKLLGKEDPYQQISMSSAQEEYFKKNFLWALKDINLSINQGDTLALIGKNGSGKTTLLKMIARVAYPTHGKIYLNGQVASLLEVGTGFHDGLSGRDNIYISGAILGMTRRQLNNCYEDIVEFSGIRKFIDTPIRRYSVGMRLRLAFSISAHLDAEILLLDEVLAVGDYSFRDKAIEHIRSLARSNRTIIYVAHQLSTIRRLCNKGILLEHGQTKCQGSIDYVLDQYVSRSENEQQYVFPPSSPSQQPLGYISTLSVLDERDALCERPLFTEQWKLKIDFILRKEIKQFVFTLQIALPNGQLLNTTRAPAEYLAAGDYSVLVEANSKQLGPGAYVISLSLATETNNFEIIKDQVALHLADNKQKESWLLDPKAIMPISLQADIVKLSAPKNH